MGTAISRTRHFRQIIMSSSLFSAWKNNAFSSPFHASCDNGEPTKPLAVNSTRTIAAASSEQYSCEFGTAKYYGLCAFGGLLSCGLTHTAVVPLDLVKCRIQVDAAKYGNIIKGFKVTLAEEGVRALAKGWAPTFIGYSLQGVGKFGFYEFFYKGLVPLWARQIPYTMMKFACFERTVEAIYKFVVPKPRAECTKSEQLVVTFAAGYIAGVFCAIVSHPADTIVSKLNQAKGSNFIDIAKQLGFMGMWKGLVPRIVMIGTLTALQWFIYDSVKVALRLPRPPPPEMPESLKKKMGIQ